MRKSIVLMTAVICLYSAMTEGKPPGGKGGGGGGKVANPKNLGVSNVSETSFDLSWDPPRKGADSYEIIYQAGIAPPADGSSGEMVTTNDTSVTVSGLDSGVLYFVRVSAVVNGNSSAGITAEARTLTDPTSLQNGWNFPHRIAISDNGHKMLVWTNFVNNDQHVFCSHFDGINWSNASDLTLPGRSMESGQWSIRWNHVDVAAGDDGNFVVGWLDESVAGDAPRVNLLRYINGQGWDNGQSPKTYGLQHLRLIGFHGIDVDMAPTGDAAAAVADLTANNAAQALRVFYAPLQDTWDSIANNGELTDAYGGEEDFMQGGPSLDMDAVGNVMVAFATDSGLFDGSMDIQYAVYDSSNDAWVGGGRQLISSGWDHNIQAVRVAVDKTRDLTDSVSADRGLAGIVWEVNNRIYGAMYYKGGSGGDVDDDFFVDIGNGNVNSLDGLDFADGAGHLLVTYTDEIEFNQKLVHFWFEDADNDGLFDSVDESDEADGSGNAGWKSEVTVNDDSILNSPYVDGDVRPSSQIRNNSRVSAGGNVGLIVWSTLAEDAVHVRRILGYDAGTQTVILEGEESTEIDWSLNHTVDFDALGAWLDADWFASPSVNYWTGEGTVLFHSETNRQLNTVDF